MKFIVEYYTENRADETHIVYVCAINVKDINKARQFAQHHRASVLSLTDCLSYDMDTDFGEDAIFFKVTRLERYWKNLTVNTKELKYQQKMIDETGNEGDS